MAKIVDDDIQQLKKKMQKLNHRIECLQAGDACENLMDKYQYYHMRGMRTEETHLFALKSPGACVEMLWGIYDEPEAVIRWSIAQGMGPRVGQLLGNRGSQHAMCTPIIEVAKDGQTARGLWLFFGYYGGSWGAGQFAMDFIKEDGEWKIWKYKKKKNSY